MSAPRTFVVSTGMTREDGSVIVQRADSLTDARRSVRALRKLGLDAKVVAS